MRKLSVGDLPDGGTPAALAAIGAGWGPVQRGGISRYDGAGHRTHAESDHHVHDVPELFTIVQGSGVLELNGAVATTFTAGDILIIEPGEDHHLISDGAVPLVFTWMHLSPADSVAAWQTGHGAAAQQPVSGTFDGGMKRYCCIVDGGMKRYCCIGDGGQGESQDPAFELAPGATLQNVIIGAPDGDGVHCTGDCHLINVWWEDVGEDAATFLQTNGGTSYVVGGGARAASDKVFQHNGNGTVNISGFYVENAGKLYRACGNCTNSYKRSVVVDNIIVRSTKVVAGINVNWGDTARFTRVTVYGTAVICDKYNGVPKGSEPTHVGSGADGVNCLYGASDITYR